MVSMKNRMQRKGVMPVRSGRIAPKQATKSCHGKGHAGFATTKDAPPQPKEEVFAEGMGGIPWERFATTNNVPAFPKKEAFALATGQSVQLAARRDASTLSKAEASAIATGQGVISAAMKDALTLPNKEASVFAMG